MFFTLIVLQNSIWNISECLATIADNIEREHFKPLAPQTLQLAMNIIAETDDPDIRKAVYSLCAALSGVMKDEILPVLPKIIEQMITSIQSSEGIVVCKFYKNSIQYHKFLKNSVKNTLFQAHYEEEDKDGVDLYGELSESDEEGEEDIGNESTSSESTICRYSVENSYNDEKEQACLSLTEICKHIG